MTNSRGPAVEKHWSKLIRESGGRKTLTIHIKASTEHNVTRIIIHNKAGNVLQKQHIGAFA